MKTAMPLNLCFEELKFLVHMEGVGQHKLGIVLGLSPFVLCTPVLIREHSVLLASDILSLTLILFSSDVVLLRPRCVVSNLNSSVISQSKIFGCFLYSFCISLVDTLTIVMLFIG